MVRGREDGVGCFKWEHDVMVDDGGICIPRTQQRAAPSNNQLVRLKPCRGFFYCAVFISEF